MSGTRALLLVPPFIKYNAGPLLGPALLASAARSRGHHCRVLDLNAKWIRKSTQHLKRAGPSKNTPNANSRLLFCGDHDKDSQLLVLVEDAFYRQLASSCATAVDGKKVVKYCFMSHSQVVEAAKMMEETTRKGH